MGGVEREFDVGGGGTGDLAELGAGDRARIVEVAPLDRCDEFAADEVVVAWTDQNLFRDGVQRLLVRNVSSYVAALWRDS